MNIYQVLPRLFANRGGKNVKCGTLEENGCGKMNDFTAEVLERIHENGYSHIWYTGLLEHATKTSYADFGIAEDNPVVVKGQAGSPYAIKDYYDIDPDLAVDVPNRMKEFEALVERTHAAGLKMVIDFVPNHVARQYKSDAKPARTKDLGQTDDQAKGFDAQNNFYYILGEALHTDFATDGKNTYEELPAKATGNDCFHAWPNCNDWYETVKLNYGVDYCGGGTKHFSPTPNTWKKMTAILLFWAK
jgi:glycosidase